MICTGNFRVLELSNPNCFFTIVIKFTMFFFFILSALGTLVYGQKPNDTPLTPEQIHEYQLKMKKIKSALPASESFPVDNDSLRDLLLIKDTINNRCLDANCYIKASEYNQFLNLYLFSSLQNRDSIQTSILFRFLRKKYIDLQSEQFDIKSPDSKEECKSTNTYYKVLVMTSTDSALIEKIVKSNDSLNQLLIKQKKIGFINHDKNDSEIVNFLFYFEKDFLDFPIDKALLDSAVKEKWSTPVRSTFGFFSFMVIDKNLCLSGYSDVNEKIKYVRFKKDDLSSEPSDSCLNINDTILVQYWSQPASLSQKRKLIKLDTTSLKGIIINDSNLPYIVRKTFRELFYKRGITYFDNFKNDYCIWSLKILKVNKGNNQKETETHYTIAKRLYKILSTEITKRDEKAESAIRNNYLTYLYMQNCLQNGIEWNEKQIPLNIIEKTERQLDKAAYNWIKSNVIFYRPFFFDRYLPQQIKN